MIFIYLFISLTALYLVLNYPKLLQWPSAGVSTHRIHCQPPAHIPHPCSPSFFCDRAFRGGTDQRVGSV